MPSPSFEEGQAAAPLHNGTPRARNSTDTKHWTTPAATHARPVVPRSAHAHHPQACEPRCADVFKHYLACADRIEQKGAGAGAASLNTNRHRTPSPRPHKKKRAGDCEPYYFDWLKCIDKCAMPHIMQKLK